MPGVTNLVPARRQGHRAAAGQAGAADAIPPTKTHTAKPRSKTSSQKIPIDGLGAPKEGTSSQSNASQTLSTDKTKHQAQKPVPSAVEQATLITTSVGAGEHTVSCGYTNLDKPAYTLRLPSSTVTTHTNATRSQLPSSSFPNPVSNFFAFGWDAFPTRASLNEVCQRFLRGRCPHGPQCSRIHPRKDSGSPHKPPKSFVVKLPHKNLPLEVIIQPTDPTAQVRPLFFQSPQSHLQQNIQHSLQTREANGEVSEVSCNVWFNERPSEYHGSKPSGSLACLPLPSINGSGCESADKDTFPHLRWEPERGLVAYGTNTVSSQNDSSSPEPSAFSSPQMSLSCSSITEGDGAPPASKKRPPPSSAAFCRKWLLNLCERDYTCNFFHGDVEYDPPVKGLHPPPQYSETCKVWLLDQCFKGYACEFVHGDLEYDATENQNSGTAEPLSTPIPPRMAHDPPVGMRPRPKNPETCILWLRDRCSLRYACKYPHDDLDYDPPKPQDPLSPPSTTVDSNVKTEQASTPKVPSTSWSVDVHDHAKVKIGAGFEMQEVVTGFETPWVYLSNLPTHVTLDDIAPLLRPFGDVLDVRLPGRVNSSTMSIRARFSTAVDARQASTALNGVQAFGCKITARLPVHSASRRNALFQDTAVRIRWEAPSKTGYGGYSTMEHAYKAIAAARLPFRDHIVYASIHVGLPAVGAVTVRFRGLPLDANQGDMERFAHPDDVVWGRPNYQNLTYAINTIKRILEDNRELLDFTVQPPPYRSGALVQAWAYFSTARDAKDACSRLHGWKPMFTGKTKIFAQHAQSLTFRVSPVMYDRLGSDIRALCRTVGQFRRTTMSVVYRNPPHPLLVKLSGDDLKELGQLKAEFEKILRWEVVRQDGNVAWDDFFASPAGASFLQDIERENPGVMIGNDVPRRMIRLLGSSKNRETIRQHILVKLGELHSQQLRTIALDGPLIAFFMSKDLMQLQEKLGRENVFLDLRHRYLKIRGSDQDFEVAREAVHTCQTHRAQRRHDVAECPVCLDKVANPVRLPCGHTWCRSCISHYLSASVDNKFFPLTCLGNEAKCTERIPLNIARKVLTASQFDAVVDAAFSSYVQTRPDEFHYCPSPDCPQIYRSAPRDTVLQCPSCLLRICPNCHVESHDGFGCPDPDGGNNLFKEWMKNHDVKPCPGCKIPIERAEGCNHMVCTQCKTHICWVCLATFPGGEGIYDHMRSMHGGIGLGPVN